MMESTIKRRGTTLLILVAAALAVMTPGCGKKDEPPTTQQVQNIPGSSNDAGPDKGEAGGKGAMPGGGPTAGK